MLDVEIGRCLEYYRIEAEATWPNWKTLERLFEESVTS